MNSESSVPPGPDGVPHRRRVRYSGKNPRRFDQKYKELDPTCDPATFAKVVASGKTPAGSHIPIMVSEIVSILRLQPGDIVVDATLGHGGHTRELLAAVQPGGRLIATDQDPVELPRTEARLRDLVAERGWPDDSLAIHRSNFAGLPKILAAAGHYDGVDGLLADLGCSSMQFDNPARGFSFKHDGPLDMRMNPQRGQPARAWLASVSPEALARVLEENADEPEAGALAAVLAGRDFPTTTALVNAIRRRLTDPEEAEACTRRVFQAVRIAVNDEFSALDNLLRVLPACVKSGGRIAMLSFHSGEDRRVKHAFAAGQRDGLYAAVTEELLRPSAEERRANPRASSARLRWAVRA